jgi:tetratricopeptide (TPR) repeat protein
MLINRGAALGTINQLEAAEQDFNQGLQLDPQNKMGYLNRAMLHLKLRQPSKTLEDYNRYLELDPGNKKIQADREKLRQSLLEAPR